jgi:hypothetical protein
MRKMETNETTHAGLFNSRFLKGRGGGRGTGGNASFFLTCLGIQKFSQLGARARC